MLAGSGVGRVHQSGRPASCTKAIGSPLTTCAETRVMLIFGASTRQPSSRPRMSTGMVRPTSDAVVTTGVAWISAATCSAIALAPPTWPESTGMTNWPASSITVTPGSTSLFFRCGAISRTTAPSETKKTSWSKPSNSGAISSRSAPS